MPEGMYPSDIRQLAHRRRELTPETEAAFQAFTQKVFEEGALPAKVKQIIAVAVAHVSNVLIVSRAIPGRRFATAPRNRS
jgi:alkylhydroperoxidase/carboxymuconolactone decarboxylase family protein YurZ